MSELNSMSCAEFHDSAAELALGVLTGRERAEALIPLFKPTWTVGLLLVTPLSLAGRSLLRFMT